MGFRFRELTGIEPFAIDQTVTVAFEPDAFAPLIEPLRPALESLGGTAGFLARARRSSGTSTGPTPTCCRSTTS